MALGWVGPQDVLSTGLSASDWTQFSDKATSELCCWSETHDVLCNLVGTQAVC